MMIGESISEDPEYPDPCFSRLVRPLASTLRLIFLQAAKETQVARERRLEYHMATTV